MQDKYRIFAKFQQEGLNLERGGMEGEGEDHDQPGGGGEEEEGWASW